ncbi:carbon-nitrogen hydrolase family protein [Helicobacter sp. 23-1045]
MKILIAQFAHISPQNKILDKHLSALKLRKKEIDLMVLGDFVLNKFFKEYHTKSALKREFAVGEKYLAGLAKKYQTTIVAPLIEWVDGSVYKSILVVDSANVKYYRATRLMSYSHWDEKSFFDNAESIKIAESRTKIAESRKSAESKNLTDSANRTKSAESTAKKRKIAESTADSALIFEVGGLKVSAIFGWEAHFDEIMIDLSKKGVDILCVPTSSSFGSNARWQRLLQTRAFLNSCFVVRVNRTGRFMESSIAWDFYGESFIALPDGSLGDMLGEKDGILVSEIDLKLLNETKEIWKLR